MAATTDTEGSLLNQDSTKQKLKVLDTFAGAGGFSLGFHLAGATIVGAIEKDKWAAETFKYNHPDANVLVANIELLTDDQILDNFGNSGVNIVLGGPPCQGFSLCVRNPGDPTNSSNSLFREFLRVGRLLQPDIMLMENVPNLAKARTETGESVLARIEFELRDMGYSVASTVLEGTDFGVPQIRKRLFVLATRGPREASFPRPTHAIAGGNAREGLFGRAEHRTPTLWDAISDLPTLEAGMGADPSPYPGRPRNDYQSQLRLDSHLVYNHLAMKHTPRMVTRFAAMSCGDSVSDVPYHLRPRKRNSMEISESVYDQNNRRMHPDRPCHTLPASFYANFVHPYSNRNFTGREGARIQSFPDWYVFRGKPTVVSQALLAREGRTAEQFLCQYNQIGNAVPPLLSQAIANHLLDTHLVRSDACMSTATI